MAARSSPPKDEQQQPKQKQISSSSGVDEVNATTHLETDAGEREHVAFARDGTWAPVVLNEGKDELGCHLARRSGQQGCA